MTKTFLATMTALGLGVASASPASACGGFFCNTQPVDQSAERIIFVANPDGTTSMAVQITYTGSAEDFAWILPLGEVPDPDSLEVLDTSVFGTVEQTTNPNFVVPEECQRAIAARNADAGVAFAAPSSAEDGGVDVGFVKNVGPFTAAAVESTDPVALVAWLKDNGYRVTPVMEPFIKLYTEEGKKFLALKLQDSADVTDIAPFAFTLPGEAPSIPLRMTAIAAEPEMGLIIHIFGDRRFGPANWPDIEVKGSEIPWVANDFGGFSSVGYFATVAKKIDQEGGLGWVTEFAGDAKGIIDNVSFNADPQNEWLGENVIEGHAKLKAMIENSAYVTRLYARLSAEEMKSDPIFKRVDGEDVDPTIQLARYVGGQDMCPWITRQNPCDVATCGAAGTCRPAIDENTGSLVAACACLPGASARNALSSAGTASTVCQDQRVSFVNPGDQQSPDETPLADPCAGFSCGEGGECVAVNMRPTCVCAKGRVAVGGFDTTGSIAVTCASPELPVYDTFYDGNLPEVMDIAKVRDVQAMPGDRLPQDEISAAGCSLQSSAPAGTSLTFLTLIALAWRRTQRRLA